MNPDNEINDWLTNCPQHRLLNEIRNINSDYAHTWVVLDDDPTGTQTVHDVPVITIWDTAMLVDLLREQCPVFYILTNSRSMDAVEAVDLVKTITRNLEAASDETGRTCHIILRSDSTLRGHHPEEMDAVLDIRQKNPELKVIHPSFIEGGRFTFRKIHYARDESRYIPCGETQFAEDPAFGYKSSNLAEWIIEKTGNRITANQITHFPVDTLRDSTVSELVSRIQEIKSGSYVIADALGYYDIDTFCLALLRSGRTFIARTAASFVASIAGIWPRNLLDHKDIQHSTENGGLIVAGSWVGKTTRQIEYLVGHSDIIEIVLDVRQLLEQYDDENYQQSIADVIQQHLENRKDVLVYTSRERLTADEFQKYLLNQKNDPSWANRKMTTSDENRELFLHQKNVPVDTGRETVAAGERRANLEIGNRVSASLSGLIGALSATPSFLIAKGGITSSDIATKALAVKRARVMGQILPGVPVWKLGRESKYPGMPYVIFPGNVGGDDAMLNAYRRIIGN